MPYFIRDLKLLRLRSKQGVFIMELAEMNGFDRDGKPTTIQLPVYRVVKQALLALDYSQGALENKKAAKQLADQFCLSEIQRTVARENGVNLWGRQVNGAIQALVTEGKLLRTKKATIITTDVFKTMIVEVLEHLDCDTREVFVRRDNEATTTLIEVKTNHLLFGMAFLKPAAGDSETENTRNTYAAYGLEILKRAVLEVLYQQQKDAEELHGQSSLRPTDIRERLDLPRRGTLIHEILMHIKADGHVEWLGSNGRWDITENGIKVIEER